MNEEFACVHSSQCCDDIRLMFEVIPLVIELSAMLLLALPGFGSGGCRGCWNDFKRELGYIVCVERFLLVEIS